MPDLPRPRRFLEVTLYFGFGGDRSSKDGRLCGPEKFAALLITSRSTSALTTRFLSDDFSLQLNMA
jgi:hypothetical protein